MGTDIHGVWQKRENNQWVDVPSTYEQDRHYQLFAALAGVRNGTGFAGVRTGQAIRPISEPRDLPDDFTLVDGSHPIESRSVMDPRRQQWADDGDMSIWMGDHSHSWLTSTEMLAWYAGAPIVQKTGILDRAVYEAWDKKSTPESYCGDISGGDVILLDDENDSGENPNWTHVQCHWTVPLFEELAYFFNEVQRLHDEHGEVRFVFGFDS